MKLALPERAIGGLLLVAMLAGCISDSGENGPEPHESAGSEQLAAFNLIQVPGDGVGEPSIAILTDGTILYQTTKSPGVAQLLRSTDDGKTWAEVTPPTQEAIVTGDWYVEADATTDRIGSLQMYGGPGCNWLSWSDDDGATWSDAPLACGRPFVDHPKIAMTDHPDSSRPYPAMYILSTAMQTDDPSRLTNINEDNWRITVDRSLDDGLTWQAVTALSDADTPGGPRTGGPLAATPDGELLFASYTDMGEVWASQSYDYGSTWTPSRAGNTSHESVEAIDPAVAFDDNGTAYVAWVGPDGIHYTWQGDGDWQPSQRISPVELGVHVFATMTAGAHGRIAVAYLASTTNATNPTDAPVDTEWHLFVSFSEEADNPIGKWKTVQLTAWDDPVQIGAICTGGLSCSTSGGRNLADFIDSTVGPDGRIYVAYADGCPEGCTSAEDSGYAIDTLAVQQLDSTFRLRP